jgi:hypothetical protein
LVTKEHKHCRHVFYRVQRTKVKKTKQNKVILEGEKKFVERKMCCMYESKNQRRS